MSNNKQTMKLYTEEEVVKLLDKYTVLTKIGAEFYLNKMNPIELPSDEEIGKLRDEYIPINEEDMWSERFYFTIGAKSVRDKIQGGNK